MAAVGLAGCGDEPEGVEAPRLDTDATPASDAVPTQPPIASPVAGYLDPERWQGRVLTIASAGVGTYLDAVTAAFFDPFAEATGATVRHQFSSDFGQLEDQVSSGEVVWDVMIAPTELVLPLARVGYLAPIDYNFVDTASLVAEVALQHGVGLAIYSTVIVYPTASGEVPGGWDAFWDLERFGEGRALRRDPVGTLEFALLADGVAMDDLYPLDVERAFASLDRIRTVTVFYESSSLPVELVASDQVGLASAWSVRTGGPEAGGAVDIQWNGGMLSADSWVVPLGAPNADVGLSFINFATRAVPSANFCRLQPFGPVNQEAFDLLLPERVALLPNAPSHRSVQFFENWNYWADNRDELTERFEDWLLTEPPEGTPDS